jgi:hypothetical protein
MNRTIFEIGRSMLHQSQLPSVFWSYAIKYAVYIRNKLLTSRNKFKTPEQLWTGIKPNLHYIRVFGCDSYIHVRDDLRKKMDSKAMKGIFLGIEESRKAQIFYVLESNKIIISRDAKYYETSFTLAKQIRETYQTGEVGSTSINYDFLDYNNNNRSNKTVSVKNNSNSNEREEKKEESKTDNRNYFQALEEEEEKNNESEQDSDDNENKSDDHDDSVDNDNNSNSNNENRPVRRSARSNIGVRGTTYAEEVALRQYNRGEQLFYAFTTSVINPEIPVVIDTNPKNYQEAINSEDKNEWIKAVGKEINALTNLNVFKECELPVKKKAMGYRWLFTKKFNKDGEVEKYKARLVAKGYTQIEGQDYTETFAPVMKYKTLRILLAIAQQFDLEIKQFDVETAFLNAELNEEVYMEIPEGYEVKNRNNNTVLKLLKALYGTKQAPREWNNKINSTFINLGFKRMKKENCVYIKKTRTGRFIILSIFVDDGTSIYHKDDEQEWIEIKEQLMKEYTIKDLGDAEWILGMRIIRDRMNKTIKLNQSIYIDKILKKFSMINCNSVLTPLDPSYKLSNNDCPTTDEEKDNMKQYPYREVIGSLQYLCYSTRPDINYAVNLLSRYTVNPGIKHWLAAKHLLQYIKGTKDYGLEFNNNDSNGNNNNLIITAYSDADWAGDLDERKSTTGYFVLINNNIVSWASKKQQTVALSSAEAEYMAITGAGSEVKWLYDLLMELELYKDTNPIIIYTDSQSAAAIANNDVCHGRTKHIATRYHWIRDEIKKNLFKLQYINTTEQIADIHTKALNRVVFEKLRNQIIYKNIG